MATNTDSDAAMTSAEPHLCALGQKQRLPANIQISLHRRQNSLSQYQSTCISKHYALNNQILTAFESHYRNGLLKVAFHLGLKFVETALLEIPKHGYFYAQKHKSLRLQSSADAIRVTQLLKEITEHDSCFTSECRKIEKLSHLASEQYERLPAYESKRDEVEKELYPAVSNWYNNYHRRSGSFTRSSNADPLTSTILACGDSFASVLCPQQGAVADSQYEYKPAFPDDVKHRYSMPTDHSDDRFPRSSTAPAALTMPAKTSATVSLSSLSTTKHEESRFPPFHAEQREPSIGNRSSSFIAKSENKDFPADNSLTRLKQTGSLLDDDNEEDIRHELQTSSDDGRGKCKHRDLRISTETDKSVELAPKPKSRRPRFGNSRMQREEEEEVVVQEEKSSEASGGTISHNLRSESDYDLQRALFLSGLGVHLENNRHPSDVSMAEIPDTNEPFAPPGARKRNKDELSIGLLSQYHHEGFDALRNNGRVIVSKIPTWQGRVPDSTNGCTVIAPLLCIHHFHNSSQIPDNGLEDKIILTVIDDETPNILPMVRKRLGLVKDAFLIPADSHEMLMEEQLMCPEQFYGVCGGNILEENHLDAFITEISHIYSEKKLAATFFFHEHVITIIQLKRGRNRVWFDLINSLPSRQTLLRPGETIDGLISGPDSMPMRLPSDGIDFGTGDDNMVDAAIPPENACRIRCLDGEALKATLKWYACSSFSEDNKGYIDNYRWDENLSDFDPRVFQAFLWREA